MSLDGRISALNNHGWIDISALRSDCLKILSEDLNDG